ncbi:hydroxyacylglutathione hydrolase [Thiomicrorhabdus sp. ZW0627]|uniref:hydroxyacylglutathione hydrolase n=1 Tax=Thiomicrorhabdus sp. ZW0627 TaxID=3039774 RepID=UPI0024368C49|nr:hydroxyacylglutathione hydrolase [Thiomicrorhabdus sp. ZW0627]MDG6772802.1 hydroxyacylglutathione hydrolase [Thiomicrorhabdus sp. ZW0627]
MKIIGIPALVGSYDNYIWVLHQGRNAWVVDPGQSAQVLDYLRQHDLSLQGILITHFHHDHVNGIADLKADFPDCVVYGPEKTDNAFIQNRVKQGDTVRLNSELEFKVLDTPGHTDDHIAYYNADMLFCGDTLFTAGCGRKFTGTFVQFAESILKLRELDDRTGFYCAHEYTVSNLKFAYLVEPENADLKQRILNTHIRYPELHDGAQSTMGEEKATNPFMRFDTPVIKAKLLARGAEDNAESLFKTLRLWKDELDQSGELDNIDLMSMVNP